MMLIRRNHCLCWVVLFRRNSGHGHDWDLDKYVYQLYILRDFLPRYVAHEANGRLFANYINKSEP